MIKPEQCSGFTILMISDLKTGYRSGTEAKTQVTFALPKSFQDEIAKA